METNVYWTWEAVGAIAAFYGVLLALVLAVFVADVLEGE